MNRVVDHHGCILQWTSLLAQADCALAVGASLNPFTRRGLGYDRTRFIHCDLDAVALGRFGHPEVAIAGDAREVAGLLLNQLPAGSAGPWRHEAAGVLYPLGPSPVCPSRPEVAAGRWIRENSAAAWTRCCRRIGRTLSRVRLA